MYPRTLRTLVALMLFLTPSLVAQQMNPQLLLLQQRQKIIEALRVVRTTIHARGDVKLQDLDGGTGAQVPYELRFGGLVSLEDAVANLVILFNSGRIEPADLGKSDGRTVPEPGANDKVLISTSILDDICTSGTDSDSVAIRTYAAICLLSTIANEAVHVHQVVTTTTEHTRCDAEADSDAASVKLLCHLQEALTDANGNAHTSLTAVHADPQASPRLVGYLQGLGLPGTGASEAAQIADVLNSVTLKKNAHQKRRDRFNMESTQPGGWTYGRKGDDFAEPEREGDPRPGRTGVDLEDTDGTTTSYLLPPGWLYTQAVNFRNADHDSTLVVTSVTPSGQRMLHFFRDADDDGMPEPTEASPPVPLPGPPSIDPGTDGMSIYPVLPPQLHPSGTGDGILVQDLSDGRFWSVPTGTDGLPVGAALALFQEASISEAGGYNHLGRLLLRPGGAIRFQFCDVESAAQHGGAAAIWVDLVGPNPTTGGVPAASGLGFTVAESFAPYAPVGLESTELDATQPRLHGNPGATVSLLSTGRGPTTLLAQGTAGVDGSTSYLNLQSTFQKNDLLRIVETGGINADWFVFVPDLGRALDFAELDENGDGHTDRIDLTDQPPRLHFSARTALNDLIHSYGAVLETKPGVTHLTSWSLGSRTISGNTADSNVTKIAGTNPPVFFESLVDLDGTTSQDAVIIKKDDGATHHVADVYHEVNTGSQGVQSIPLPQGFEPRGFEFLDVNGDGALDICVADFFGGPSLRLMNDGSGGLSVQLGTYGGSGEDLDVTIAVNGTPSTCRDIHVVQPGDHVGMTLASPQGTFDFQPLLLVAQQFATGTPPTPPVPFFELAIGLTGPFAPFVLVDGTAPTPLGFAVVLQPGGNSWCWFTPPSLAGQSVMLQGIIPTPQAANGFFAVAPGHELRVP